MPSDPSAKVPQKETQVEIFTKPGCPHCHGLKHRLEHEGMPFIEYDVQSDPTALQRMLALNGGRRHVPTIVMGGQVTVGFHGI